MHILHTPDDPFIAETLQYIASNALESPQSNFRIQVGKITLACTSDALATQAITYAKQFKSTPYLITSINPAVTSSVATKTEANQTANGFTAQVYTSSNQNVDFTYLAIGPV